MRTLPQRHCFDQTDHPAHTETVQTGANRWTPWFRCPGRYTPSKHRAPATMPTIPADPFAGIAGAADDSEVW